MGMPRQRDKQTWRAEILATRAAVDPVQEKAEAASLAAAMRDLRGADLTCAYVPARDEPGSTAMLDALRAQGGRVLLPVTGAPGALDWAEYTGPGDLRPARYGLLEPAGPALGPDAVAEADLIVIPALAVDRRGVRLGRGAGYYDRTLGAARPRARLVAVVRDEEFVASLPEEEHDIRVGWVITPGGGLTEIDRDRCVE